MGKCYKRAIPYVIDKKIHSTILRIINIWEERDVFDKSYLANLTALLNTPIQKLKLTDPEQEFQVHELAAKIHSSVKLKQKINLKLKHLEESNLSFTDNEAMQNILKDKIQSQKFLNQLNDDNFKIKSRIKWLHREITDRTKLIDALQVAKSYYKEQNDEVKYVAQAYFNYTKNVKLVESELKSLVDSMPTDSPISLPDINAPSPSTSFESIEDSDLHNINYDTVLNSDKYMKNSSMENSINNINFDVVTTTKNIINSYITPDTFTSVQEYQNQQSLTSQFPYDVPSLPPDETFGHLAFPNQFEHCAIESKMIDRDEQVSKEMITYTSDVTHKNLISLTHHPQINSSMVSVDVDNQSFPSIPMPPSAPAILLEALSIFNKQPKDKNESVDMELSDDDEEPKSNYNQKHAIHLPPAFLPITPFDLNQQKVQDVPKQWQSSFQPWSNNRPSFNRSQWNVGQSDQWKHHNQWEHGQYDSNFVYNQSQLQQPQFQQSQRFQRYQPKEDFRPKWKSGTSYWPRGSRNFVPHSRPTDRWNKGPRFGPRNQSW